MNVFLTAAVNIFVRAIPSHLMAYYPFRDRMRFALWKVLLPVCIIQIVHSLLYGYTILQGGNERLVDYRFALIYMAVYFFSVREDHFKVLFLYIFVTDYMMILRGIAAFLEARFFYQPGMTFTSWTSTLLNLVLLAISAPSMLRLFADARDKVFSTDAPVFWRTAWMVPAFTTAIVIIFTADFQPEKVRSVGFLFARVLLLLSIFVVYSNLLNALDGIRRQAALAEQAGMQEHLLNLQRIQYERLVKQMEETREIRHEIRQHFSVIQAYLDQRDIEGAKAYLDTYAKTVPTEIHRTFTLNFSLNAVCTHYAEEARRQGIDYDVSLNMPERLPISEPEVCALLGNLLENAVDACLESQHSAPFIRVRGAWEDGHIVFTVDNSCEREPQWENGRLLSSKREGFGTGTWLVQRAAERSGGTADFTYRDGVFYASVLLYG